MYNKYIISKTNNANPNKINDPLDEVMQTITKMVYKILKSVDNSLFLELISLLFAINKLNPEINKSSRTGVKK